MKHLKTITYSKEVVTKIVCDLCGENVEKGLDNYSVDVCTVKRVHGERYPEGDFTTTQEIDLCGQCFEQAIVRAVEEHGGTMREFDTDAY